MQTIPIVFWGAFFGGMSGVLLFFVLVGLYSATKTASKSKTGGDSGA